MQRTMMQVVIGTCACASSAMAYVPGPNVIYGTEFNEVGTQFLDSVSAGTARLNQLGDSDVQIQITDFANNGLGTRTVSVHAPSDSDDNPVGMQMWGPQAGTAELTEGADNSTWVETQYDQFPGVYLITYMPGIDFRSGAPTTQSDPQIQHGFRTADGRYGFLQFADQGDQLALSGWALQLEPDPIGFQAFDVLTIPTPGGAGLLAIAGLGAARRRRSG